VTGERPTRGWNPPNGSRSPVAGDSHCSLTSEIPKEVVSPRDWRIHAPDRRVLARCRHLGVGSRVGKRDAHEPKWLSVGAVARRQSSKGKPSPWKKRATACWQRHEVATDSSAEQRPGVELAPSASLRRCGKGDSAGVETRTGHLRQALRSRSGVTGRGTTADRDEVFGSHESERPSSRGGSARRDRWSRSQVRAWTTAPAGSRQRPPTTSVARRSAGSEPPGTVRAV
jgi:hypothetical protein